MLRVQRVDEQLAALQKPVLEPMDWLRLGSDDCLVVCAGFEDRAVAFLRSAAARKSECARVLVVTYLPSVIENRVAEVENLCGAARFPMEAVDYDRENPSGFGDVVCDKLGSVPGRVYIDVSGMSRLLIVQILVSLAKRPSGLSRCSVLYAEASEYPPAEDQVTDEISKSDLDPLYLIMLLSSGVFEVTVLPELASASLDGQQIRLVAFPSFNTDQFTALRTELQPSRYSIIHGVPPAPENKWRTQAIAKLNHVENLQGAENFHVSTLDYREILNCLLEIYRKHSSFERILIAPTGSKMQAVAVGIFRSFVKDVQIVYPTPRTFTSPERYTQGVKCLYHLPLDSFSLPGAR